MSRRIDISNPITVLSKVRIVKNLIVASVSFFIFKTGDVSIFMLQTTMNKDEGIGTISMAVNYISYGLTSLLVSSFLIKKLSAKNSIFLAVITSLPFLVSNFYPTWIIMLPSAIIKGFSNAMLYASQCSYFNESCVLFCKITRNRKKPKCSPKISHKYKNSEVDKETKTSESDEQKLEPLSAFGLLSKTGENPVLNGGMYHLYSSPVIGYKFKKAVLSENVSFVEIGNTETKNDTKIHRLKLFNGSSFSKAAKNISNVRKVDMLSDTENEQSSKYQNVEKEDILSDAENEQSSKYQNVGKEDILSDAENEEISKHQTYVDSTKSFFFGMCGSAYYFAMMLSGLISYYILNTGGKGGHTKSSNSFCGASFCSTNEEVFSNRIDKVPDETRYFLSGIGVTCGIVAPLLILLFLDHIGKTTNDVKLSWDHIFATIKYITKKDQLLIIPFTVCSSLCRGFYVADFTKAYVTCAWSISHIGLITCVYGASSALSSLFSGIAIKYAGRISVMVLCFIITITNFVFLFFWSPDAQQPFLFHVQGVIFGIISGIFDTQTKAFYGILFEGDEETAFSSFNMYISIGWFLPFIYNDLFCVTMKIYIMLAFSCTGLLGYLLAERRYSLRSKSID